MNLGHLSTILAEKNREYDVAHSRILRSLNLDKNVSLRSYITLIRNDPVEWLKLAPIEHTKPKTAILYLLEKCDSVREEIGVDECNQIAAEIRKLWKQLRKKRESELLQKVDNSKLGLLKNEDNTKSVLINNSPIVTSDNTTDSETDNSISESVIESASVEDDPNDKDHDTSNLYYAAELLKSHKQISLLQYEIKELKNQVNIRQYIIQELLHDYFPYTAGSLEYNTHGMPGYGSLEHQLATERKRLNTFINHLID